MPEFILKDRYGKEQTFDHNKIFVMDPQGGLIQFTQGEGDIPAVVQPLEVTENGEYTAPAGVDGFSPVTVNVPDIPAVLQDKTITENGTYTADSGFDGLGSVIVDVLSSGGGGGKWAWGTFTGNNAPVTINHNLGIVPDVVIIKICTVGNLGNEGLYEIVAFLEEKALPQIVVDSCYGWVLTASYGKVSSYTTAFSKQKAIVAPIDSADGDPINNANETSFTVGNTTAAYYPIADKYNWIAIGGLNATE